MLIKIREGFFETNSSSTHSLSIAENKPSLTELKKEYNGKTITITGGEFGWDSKEYNAFEIKLDYIFTNLRDTDSTLKKYQKINKKLEKDLIVFLKNKLGVDVLVDINSDSDCYIDHQSISLIRDELLDDNDEWDYNKLFNFLFSEESSVETSSDNE
jgi:hypothetical protein